MSDVIAEVPEIDLHGEAFLADPHAFFADLHDRTPIARSRRGYEVLSFEWQRRLFADKRFDTPNMRFLIDKGAPPTFATFLEHGFLLGIQGERHDAIRRVIQKGFTLGRIDDQAPMMRRIANELIDRFIDRGEADLVADYTMLFPVFSLCRLLGVPDVDIPRFQEAGVVLHLMGAQPIAPEFPKIEAGLKQLGDYVGDLVRERRARPQDDFISALIKAQETEGLLSEDELVWNIANLLFAGQDTTRFQLAGVVRAMIEAAPEMWDRLAGDPSIAEAVLWEGMRYYTAGQWGSRMVIEDCEFNGFPFKAGQRVFLQTLAGSRDPRSFPDPTRFDIERPERFLVNFGRGLHNCVGQVLARTGMEESLKVMSQRMKDLELAGPVKTAKANAMVGGPVSMPIRFKAR